METITIKTTSTNRQFVRTAIVAAGLEHRVIISTQGLVTGSLEDLREVYFALEAMREKDGWAQSFKFITKRIGVAVGERK